MRTCFFEIVYALCFPMESVTGFVTEGHKRRLAIKENVVLKGNRKKRVKSGVKSEEVGQ